MSFFPARAKRKFLAEAVARRHAEDDLLSPAERNACDAAIERLRNAPPGAPEFSAAAEAWRKLCPDHHWLRNWLDLFIVVGAVAFGVRGLYLQPFKIPTGSMQPTLYGIHFRSDTPLGKKAPGAINYALYSVRRAEAKTSAAGMLDVDSFRHSGFWTDRTSFVIGDRRYSLPGEPRKVVSYAGLNPEKEYLPDETLANGFLSLGDHLFVERFSLYLAPPERGEVMVFSTEGLTAEGKNLTALSGYYYVKRLAALPGDVVKLENNRLWIKAPGAKKFVPVTELAPRFKKVYSGKGGYQGHLDSMGVPEFSLGTEYTVPPDHYFMLGDNSAFSLDSRFFGAVPRRNLVGRAWFVFWPFTRRWGTVDHAPPLDVPTGEPENGSFKVMELQ